MRIPERFIEKVADPDSRGCLLWTAAKSAGGYGAFKMNGRTYRAHRLAYEWLVGPIPDGLVLDHLCRVRHCVNPHHLEPVTNKVNALRGERSNRPRCPQGHAYSEANTYLQKSTGHRMCRACNLARYHARKG